MPYSSGYVSPTRPVGIRRLMCLLEQRVCCKHLPFRLHYLHDLKPRRLLSRRSNSAMWVR